MVYLDSADKIRYDEDADELNSLPANNNLVESPLSRNYIDMPVRKMRKKLTN